MGGGGILQGDGAEEVAQEAEGSQGQDTAGNNAVQLRKVARILSLCSRHIILGNFKYVREGTLHVVTCFKTYLYVEQHKMQLNLGHSCQYFLFIRGRGRQVGGGGSFLWPSARGDGFFIPRGVENFARLGRGGREETKRGNGAFLQFRKQKKVFYI